MTKSHFKGKKTGYYSLAYADDSQVITFYEIPPFEAILNEEEEPDTYIIAFEETPISDKIRKQGVIALNTNFMDETNIFDKFDIEKQTNFKTNISNIFEEYEEYEANCRLVKYIRKPLMVFCELDESIPPRKIFN